MCWPKGVIVLAFWGSFLNFYEVAQVLAKVGMRDNSGRNQRAAVVHKVK